jgi:energy-coupling factor transporter ATP-binding protein EcfA2
MEYTAGKPTNKHNHLMNKLGDFEKKKWFIALTGNMGSGKSTVAKILVEQRGFTELAFADPLKQFAISIGFKPSEVYGTQAEKLQTNGFWGISGREFMQKFGSEICRDILPAIIPDMKMESYSVWIRALQAKMEQHDLVVVSDCRFLDEERFVRSQNGYIIKLVRDQPVTPSECVLPLIAIDQIGDITDYTTDDETITTDHTTIQDEGTKTTAITIGEEISSVTTHRSETELSQITPNFVIENNGTIENLEVRIEMILKAIILNEYVRANTDPIPHYQS